MTTTSSLFKLSVNQASALGFPNSSKLLFYDVFLLRVWKVPESFCIRLQICNLKTSNQLDGMQLYKFLLKNIFNCLLWTFNGITSNFALNQVKIKLALNGSFWYYFTLMSPEAPPQYKHSHESHMHLQKSWYFALCHDHTKIKLRSHSSNTKFSSQAWCVSCEYSQNRLSPLSSWPSFITHL